MYLLSKNLPPIAMKVTRVKSFIAAIEINEISVFSGGFRGAETRDATKQNYKQLSPSKLREGYSDVETLPVNWSQVQYQRIVFSYPLSRISFINVYCVVIKVFLFYVLFANKIILKTSELDSQKFPECVQMCCLSAGCKVHS